MTDQEILNCIYGIYPNRRDTPSTVDLLIKNNLAVKLSEIKSDKYYEHTAILTTVSNMGNIDTHIPIGAEELMYNKYRKALLDMITLIGGEFD